MKNKVKTTRIAKKKVIESSGVRKRTPPLKVKETSVSKLQTRYYGALMAHCFVYKNSGEEILVLVVGDPLTVDSPLVRIHSRCLTGDVFGSAHCECGQQIELSLQKMQSEGAGILIYLEQEGRGSGLAAKLKAYELKEHEGLDTVDAYKKLELPVDSRTYEAAIHILKYMMINKLRLLTNNPDKIVPLQKAGFQVQRESLEIAPNPWNADYLKTKKQRMGHLLNKV